MRVLNFFHALLGSAILGGCSSLPYTPTAERDATFAPYRDTKIEGLPIQAFLGLRTGIVLAAAELTFEPEAKSASGLNFHANARLRVGSAAAIDSRGYFLTAAHVVAHGPITVLFSDGSAVQHQSARLVWLGYNAPGSPDLALVHIDASLPATFAWSLEHRTGDAVFGGGLNYAKKGLPRFDIGFVAGKLLTIPTAAPTPEQTVSFTSDLLLHEGDSGGPLVDAHGRLLGINGVVTFGLARALGLPGKLTCYAVRPDTDWLRQLIEKDLAAHQSADTSSPKKP